MMFVCLRVVQSMRTSFQSNQQFEYVPAAKLRTKDLQKWVWTVILVSRVILGVGARISDQDT